MPTWRSRDRAHGMLELLTGAASAGPLACAIVLTSMLAQPAAHAQVAPAENFCVFEERTSIGTHIVKQFTVMRCDEGRQRAGWFLVKDGGPFSFLAALALRDSRFSANQPEVWCVGRRFGAQAKTGDTIKVREDQATQYSASSGSGWTFTCNLTSDEADAMLKTINASLPGTRDWCV